MTRQLGAELLKIRTIRAGWVLVLATLGLVGLTTISIVATEARDVLALVNEQRQVIRIAAIADVFALILGITISGGEQSHGTITQTFLVEPVRERVLAAKALVAAALGALLGAAAVALDLAIAVPWLSSAGIDLQLDDPQLRRVALGTVLAGALAAALGVGLGAIFRRQGSAVTAALIYLLLGQTLLHALLGEQREYAPGAAFAALVNGSRERGGEGDFLAMWPGFAVAAAYAVAFLALGALALGRRDV